MVLVANKVDLVHLRKITADQGQEMAAKHNVSSEPFLKHLFHFGFYMCVRALQRLKTMKAFQKQQREERSLLTEVGPCI